ncbi:MAG: HNH endonuclease [Nanoarchaeota archaeon]|nr:HNH endonuclease [Nanoarchaeota archaeon]
MVFFFNKHKKEQEYIDKTEDIINKITRNTFEEMEKMSNKPTNEGMKHEPLTLMTSTLEDNEYTIVDENGNEDCFYYTRDKIIEALKKYDNDIKKAFSWLKSIKSEEMRESSVKREVQRLKDLEFKKIVREEAEKRVFGKVSNKRIPISEQDKEIIFKKFNNKCSVCNKAEGLHIHHKDKNPKNNRMDNLIVLCGVCHKKIHMKVR